MNPSIKWSTLCRLAVFALLSAPFTGYSAAVSITEFVDFSEGPTYRVDNNSDTTLAPFSIFGFAVSNNTSETASTSRRGWSASVVSSEAWDAGYDMYRDFLAPVSTLSIGSFSSLFGSADHVNLYWHLAHYGDNIFAGESSSEFHWGGFPESDFVAFDVDESGAIAALARGPATVNKVPDSASYASMFAFLMLLGFVARRRRVQIA